MSLLLHPHDLSAQGCQDLLHYINNNLQLFDLEYWNLVSIYINDALDNSTLWWHPKDHRPWLFDLIKIEHLVAMHHPSTHTTIHRIASHTSRFFANASVSLYRDFLANPHKINALKAINLIGNASMTVDCLFLCWLNYPHVGLTRDEIMSSMYLYLVPQGLRTLIHLCCWVHNASNKDITDSTHLMAVMVATTSLWTGPTFASRWTQSPNGLGQYMAQNKLVTYGLISPEAAKIWTHLEDFLHFSSHARQAPCTICNKMTPNYCRRCTINYYCDINCQRKHWPLHRHECAVHAQVRAQHLFATTSYRRFFRYLQFYRSTIQFEPTKQVTVVGFTHVPECVIRLHFNPRVYRIAAKPVSTAKMYCCWRCEEHLFGDSIRACARNLSVAHVSPDISGIFRKLDRLMKLEVEKDGSVHSIPLLIQYQLESGGYNWGVYVV